MKGLLLIRRLFPETKHNPIFGLDYTIADFGGAIVLLAYPKIGGSVVMKEGRKP